jgi:hypothetical protein
MGSSPIGRWVSRGNGRQDLRKNSTYSEGARRCAPTNDASKLPTNQRRKREIAVPESVAKRKGQEGKRAKGY